MSSAPVTIGVEEEFHLVDPLLRVPAQDAERVLAAARGLGLELEAELQRSQIEVATGVCTTLPELRAQIRAQRQAAAAAAELPPALWAQLRTGGRIAIPLETGGHAQHFCALERTPGGPRLIASVPARFVPLVQDKG